jgi:hypothetical protein
VQPGPENQKTQAQNVYLKSPCFEHLPGRLTYADTQRVSHGELEALVQAEGGELLRRLIQGHLDQRCCAVGVVSLLMF